MKKKFCINVTIEKNFDVIITANNQRQAYKKAKEKALKKTIKKKDIARVENHGEHYI